MLLITHYCIFFTTHCLWSISKVTLNCSAVVSSHASFELWNGGSLTAVTLQGGVITTWCYSMRIKKKSAEWGFITAVLLKKRPESASLFVLG